MVCARCAVLAVLAVLLSAASSVTAGFFDKRHVQLDKFKYELCDRASEGLNAAWGRDVHLMTTFDGALDVTGTLITAINLTEPVQAKVELERRLLGVYIPLPCIKQVGSCTYPDLCKYGLPTHHECPPLFDEHDVPCRCPIERGVYELPGGQMEVPVTRWAGLLAGRYRGKVRFYHGDRHLVCYRVTFELQ